MGKGRYSVKILIGSILSGIVFALIGEVLYQALRLLLPRVAVAEIYFVGMFLFLSLAIWLISKLAYARFYGGVLWGQWVKAFLAMLVLTAVFELLYELQINLEQKKKDSYVFVIDSSGSMEKTDPEGRRFQAIDRMLKEKPQDFPYAVYFFSDQVTCVRKMAPQSEGGYPREENGGKTVIRGALETVRDDIKSGALDLKGQNARIIFLSDGLATDMEGPFSRNAVIRTLKDYAEEGVSISTVGLLQADRDLMAMIAEKTGGMFVDVQDVNDLEDAMVQAGTQEKDSRHLLGYRNGESADLLYALMRILFITVLGALVGVAKTAICERFLDTAAILKSSLAGSALAGLCIEAGMNGAGLHPVLCRILACVLISFTLLKEDFAVNK